MHAEARAYVEAVAKMIDSPGAVLEIGSRNFNGSVRELFSAAEIYHGIDVRPGPGVDEVADGATYEPPFVPTIIVCCEVLEHTPHAEAIIRHAHELLAPMGVFILTCAAPPREPHSAIDGGPQLAPDEHYANIDPEWLKEQMQASFEFTTVNYSPDRGDLYALGMRIC